MESNLADAFALKVNCNTDTAYSFLHANQWDLDKALSNWRETQEDNPNEPENDFNGRNDVKKLSRGISRATDNVNLVSKTRCEFAQDFKLTPSQMLSSIESTGYSFTLPDLTIYGEDFVRFLEKDLIDKSALTSLEESKRLNWWAESVISHGLYEKLWPLLTTGDGNCLLHAASLAIWGFHDRLLTLREALHEYLDKNVHMENLFRRWRWQITKQNDLSGFTCTEEQWARDWRNIINMASAEPRNFCAENGDSKVPSNNNIYESLEEFHVLALAHILRRPIIVVADVMLKDMNNEPFSPIHFGGIYLPFECSPKLCHRSPLLLTFDKGHFSALVPMENVDKNNKEKLSLIPLTDSEGMLLPVQFCVDPGPTFNWDETYEQSFINSLLLSEKDQIALLKKYLDVVDLSETENQTTEVDSEDEIERKYVEISDFNDGEISIFGHKNRATKQLQSVARQFGSIGKSMSKKLKKNFGSITKPKQKRNDANKHRLICAEIHAKRHENHEQMIKNYLTHIQKKFLSGNQRPKSNGVSTESMRLQQQAILEGPMKCINTDCNDFGTVITSYMCDKCYETQRNQELNVNTDSRISTGKSRFYRDTDFDSYDAVRRLPVHRPIYQSDQTLYLLKSTFYYDNEKPENNNQITESSRIEDISHDIDLDTREKPRKTYHKRSMNATVTSDKENHHPDNSTNRPDSRHIVKMDVTLSNASSKSPTNESNGNNIHERRTPFTQNNLNHLISDTGTSITDIASLNKGGIFKDIDMREAIPPNLFENKYVNEDIMRLSDLPDRPPSNYCKPIYRSPPPNYISNHDSYENGYEYIENENAFFDHARFPHLQNCKSNSCPNIASEHTNFYCTDCWNKRQL